MLLSFGGLSKISLFFGKDKLWIFTWTIALETARRCRVKVVCPLTAIDSGKLVWWSWTKTTLETKDIMGILSWPDSTHHLLLKIKKTLF